MNEQNFRGILAPDREYALGFQPDGVQLLRRDHAGWAEMGTAFFEGDLRRELGEFAEELRVANAARLALVIPEDQILYTDLVLPQAATTEAALKAGLEGLTPYPVGELAYDIAPSDAVPGTAVKIAAVARQTLQEAEDFAVRHGFAPDRFLAAPAPDQFPHMPDFGATELANEWQHAAELAAIAEPDDPAQPVATMADNTAIVTPEKDGLPGAEAKAPAEAGLPDQTADIEAVAEASAAHVSLITPHVVATSPENAAAPAQPAKVVVVNRGTIVLEDDEPALSAPEDALPVAEKTAPEPQAPAKDTPAPTIRVRELPERAQKFHERAAEGRSKRAAPAAPARAGSRPGRRSGLSGALPLVGILVLGLGIAATMIGREPEEVLETAAVNEPLQAPVETAPTLDAAPEIAAVQQAPVTQPAPAELPAQSSLAAPENIAASDPPPEAAQAGPEATPVSPAPDAAPVNDSEGQLAQASLTEEAASIATGSAAALVQSAYDAPVDASTSAEELAEPEAPPAPASADPQEQAEPEPEAAPVVAATRPAARPDDLARNRPSAPSQTAPETAAPQTASVNRTPAIRPVSRPAQNTRQNTGLENAATPAPGAPSSSTLQRSARPQTAPSRSAAPAAASAAPDPRPAVPRSPSPYQQRQQPEMTGTRPPPKPSVGQSSAQLEGAALLLQPAPRHMAALSVEGYGEMLARMDAPWLRTQSQSYPLIRTAQSRPVQRPTRSDAVDSAVAEAIGSSRPARRSDAPAPEATPQRQASAASNPGRLDRSARPARRPGGTSPATDSAVEAAIASAVSSSAAVPGQIAGLLPLTSSARPSRRGTPPSAASDSNATDQAVTAALASPSRSEGTLAPEPADNAASKQAAEAAALAERRRLDEELQRQAEQRVRERAAADARAAAQAKAAAEARARAQAEAEAAEAARRNQTYRPPEVDNEPEVQSTASAGSGAAASRATSKGIDLNATQLIGTVGAGKASRGLVRLRNGRIVTVRLGDKINGGQIVEIGNGGLQYVKAGRKYSLPILNRR
ncbi:hypothetical protein [Paracoccus aerodenitrificans]|uniref:hypothetical protein n=1 Tax=Paracoccus aerodenitrificans TaxID=3017781 RepID=UPI0022F0D744|nr:hypothetical protein [Paracoccus aerodenitrificans]WBU63075.1 hypothetical protein PAE61_11960 [Paracoccus aerodenitrificans]